MKQGVFGAAVAPTVWVLLLAAAWAQTTDTRLLQGIDGASGERRVALVIGNATYSNAAALRNPRNDAEDVARTLRAIGFTDVELLQEALTRSMTRGLVRVGPAGGATFVAFAAREGTVAQDGDGRNSPVAAALIQGRPAPGLPLERLFGAVRDEVMQATGQRQEPYLYGSFGRDPIYLVQPTQSAAMSPASPPARPSAQPAPSIDRHVTELTYWQSIQSSSDREPDSRLAQAVAQARAAAAQAREARDRAYADAERALTAASARNAGIVMYGTGLSAPRFRGEVRNSQAHGFGILTLPGGGTRAGRWIDGDSAEVQVGSSGRGDWWSGEARNSQPDGYVVLIYQDGTRYEGRLVTVPGSPILREGYGIYTAASGLRYEGQWRRDLRSGSGVEFLSDGRISRQGVWADGNLSESYSSQ